MSTRGWSRYSPIIALVRDVYLWFIIFSQASPQEMADIEWQFNLHPNPPVQFFATKWSNSWKNLMHVFNALILLLGFTNHYVCYSTVTCKVLYRINPTSLNQPQHKLGQSCANRILIQLREIRQPYPRKWASKITGLACMLNLFVLTVGLISMLCPIKVNSNTIELTVHTSCYCVLDLLQH